ncbi:MAG: RNA polymerase sigma factor [Solirubrobacterales bacterium]
MPLDSTDISRLYREHAYGVLKFAMRRTLDSQVSVDLVGETFAVAFEQRGTFRGVGDVQQQSWIFGIANNLLNNYFRSGQIESRAMERLGVPPTAVPDDQLERIEQLACTAELRALVADALRELTPDHRDALQLRVVDELPYREVAWRLAVNEQTARARVSRALGLLRDRLDMNENDEVMEHA